ncbi:MAG: MFS transporter [Gammaproteobacteria bacterium]
MSKPSQAVGEHPGLLVFALVAAAFTNIYLTQPVLPVLARDLGTTAGAVSITVSACIVGLAIANIPWGIWADRHRIGGILVAGGVIVALAGVAGYFTESLAGLAVARFVQGLALPALLTCVAAYLGRILPPERLNVVMGAYVSATVVGGLTSRLMGGWFFPEGAWREALLTAALLVLVVSLIAARLLPDAGHGEDHHQASVRFGTLLKRGDVWRILGVAFVSFFVFQSVFNYLPFRLAAAPLGLDTAEITASYFAYAAGAVMAPLAGGISNRLGNGNTITLGALTLGLGIGCTLIDSVAAIIVGLFLLCVGFFSVHAAAVGGLNNRLAHGKGRANALYVMFYYVGGFVGITVCGWVYEVAGWDGLIGGCLGLLVLPVVVGMLDQRGSSAQGRT